MYFTMQLKLTDMNPDSHQTLKPYKSLTYLHDYLLTYLFSLKIL